MTIPADTWSIHAQGLLELIRLRGPEQLQTHTGRNIFWFLALSTQIRSLIAGIECPSFIKTWLDDLHGRNPTIDADLVRLNSFTYTTTLLSARTCRTLRGSSPELLGSEIDSVWSQVQAIEVLFHKAMDDTPLGETISLDKIHLCNMYRVSYMRTLQFMLDLAHAEFLQHEAAVDQNQISALITHGIINIRSLAAESVRTIPYVLGQEPSSSTSATSVQQLALDRSVCWADVLRLLWPVRIILARKQLVDIGDIQTVEDALHKIGTDYCIRQAMAPLPTTGVTRTS